MNPATAEVLPCAQPRLSRQQLAALDLIKDNRWRPGKVAETTLAALVRRDMIRMEMGRWELTDAGRSFCFPPRQ